ncbi:MAG: glycosyltransferase family 4 protein [Inquilinaceae bacterium]
MTQIAVPPPRPKLLYVATEDWFFCSHFLPMARAARDAGFDVTVAARVRDHGPRIAAEGFALVDLPGDRGSLSPLHAGRQVRVLAKLFRRLRPDLVHLIALRPIIAGGLAVHVTDVRRVVYAITGAGYLSVARTTRARAARWAVSRLLHWLVRQPGARVLLENPDDGDGPFGLGLGPDDPSVTIVGGAGVDTDSFPNLPAPEGPRVTAALVGRMVWSKGVDTAVEAQAILQRRGVALDLLLVGAPDPDNPAGLAAETLIGWAKAPGVRWLGPRSDLVDIWRRADIALVPSRGGEGLPKALLEAAACGRPIVAADVPGCRAFVRHGIEGLLVPPGRPDALADALETLVSAPERRHAMGLAARRRVESGFTEAHVANAVVALYANCLKTR